MNSKDEQLRKFSQALDVLLEIGLTNLGRAEEAQAHHLSHDIRSSILALRILLEEYVVNLDSPRDEKATKKIKQLQTHLARVEMVIGRVCDSLDQHHRTDLLR